MLQGAHFRETRTAAREIKFLVEAGHAAEVLRSAGTRLAPDPHGGGPSGGEYRTTTIYFDTGDGAVYQRRGSYGRSKLRIRRYGSADVAYLERKLRTSSLLSKRRTAIALGDLPQLEGTPDTPYQWFRARLVARRLGPVCQVSYSRHALVGNGFYGPMRLTFDDDIRAQLTDSVAFSPGEGLRVLEGYVIIEMKFCVDTPGVLKEMVEHFRLSPAPVSKFRTAMTALTTAGTESVQRTSAAEGALLATDEPLRGLAGA